MLKYDIQSIGYDALLISFSGADNAQLMPIISKLHHSLEQIPTVGSSIIDTIASYKTLLIQFHLLKTSTTELRIIIEEQIGIILSQVEMAKNSLTSETIIIPACYHPSLAIDIEVVAGYCQLSVEEVIDIHSSTIYTCYAIGFMPGFGYLGDLDARLSVPRHQTPRAEVNSGSIAIADNQTAIYPKQSPGGWHIIASTPQSLFHIQNSQALPKTLLTVGCQVKFQPISLFEYNELQQQNKTIEDA